MTRRRANNEGSVYKRKDGRWVGQVTVQGRPVAKYGKTKGECLEWVKTMLAQIDGGMNWQGTRVTLAEYMQEWLKTVQNTVKPKTIEQYIQVSNQHILPMLGKYKLKDLRPDRIQAFYNRKLEGGASQRTVVMIHNVLHHALRRALQLGLVTRNSTDAVVKPKLKRTEMHVLDEIQVRSLLMAAKSSKMEGLLQLAITTGMREGELIGLKWADLDWTGRRLHVQRQVQRIKKEGLVFSSPKTAKSRRVVALGSGTIEKLREQLERQQLERMFAGTKWVENDLIFANTIGKPMEPANVLKLFKELLVKANLPDIRFHDLRHTAATLMLLQEVHPKIVQERLGHSDISLTLNTYSHVLPSMQEGAADKMDELVTLTDVGKELQKKKVAK